MQSDFFGNIFCNSEDLLCTEGVEYRTHVIQRRNNLYHFSAKHTFDINNMGGT